MKLDARNRLINLKKQAGKTSFTYVALIQVQKN